MIDPRVTVYPMPDGRVTALGRRFANLEECEVWLAAAIPRREAIAGRALSAAELFDGVDHADDTTTVDKVYAANWRVPMVAVKDESDPFDDPLLLEKKGPYAKQQFDGPRNRKELAQAAREQYEKRTGIHVDSPEVLAAREYALQAWEAVAFDPSQPQSALVRAAQLKHTAWTDGADFVAFAKMSQDFAASQQERYTQARTAAEQERAAAAAKLSAIPQPVGAFGSGLAPGDKVLKLQDLQGNKFVRIVSGNVVKQQWAEADAPAEVVEAAQ